MGMIHYFRQIIHDAKVAGSLRMPEYDLFKPRREEDVRHIANLLHNYKLRKTKHSCHFRFLQVKVQKVAFIHTGFEHK